MEKNAYISYFYTRRTRIFLDIANGIVTEAATSLKCRIITNKA